MPARSLCSILLVLLLAGFAAPVAAEPSNEDYAKAEAHFRKGAEWYAQGEFAKAIVEFKFGNALAPNAMFFYNMSLAYERLDSFDDAIDAANRAQAMGGMPDEIALRNQARLTGFEIIVAGRAAATDISAAVAQRDSKKPVEQVPATVERPDGLQALGVVGVGIAMIGGGLAVGGLLTNAAVNSDLDGLREAASAGDEVTYQVRRTEIEKKQARGKLLYTFGAIAGGVGMGMFVIDLIVGTKTVPVETSIVVGPGTSLVRATMRF